MIQLKKDASLVSWLLIAAIILVSVAIIMGSWFIQKRLSHEVELTTEAKERAVQSSSDIQKAAQLQSYLKSHAEEVARATSIVNDTKAYQYQNQIVEDINRYAASAGVTILGFDFPIVPSASKATGVKTLDAIITLQSPVQYTSYLTFLKLIEQNLTKMQITEMKLKAHSTNPEFIDAQTLAIQVYTR